MKNAWDARINRATELSSVYPFAAEGLRFYAQVAMLQQKLHFEFQQSPAHFFTSNSSDYGELNLDALSASFAKFLADMRKVAPAVLANAGDRLTQRSASLRSQLLENFWFSPTAIADGEQTIEGTPAERCVAWLFLQPAAEYLSTRKSGPTSGGSSTTCPRCGSKPIVGVLRPEGDGAKKSLVCMLCAYEWPFRRIYCPSCGEERDAHMAFYSAPTIPHVRVDVCDTCHTYLKTVDLTKTGLAVPVVDELGTPPLDLWAREQGYRKLQMNIVGI
jgi:formate dehydrogenase accessory protein FdhE